MEQHNIVFAVAIGVIALMFLVGIMGNLSDNIVGEAKGGKGKTPSPQCSDNKDNDGDRKCDVNGCYTGKGKKNRVFYGPDPECTSSEDNSEAPVCGDGLVESGEVCDGNNFNGRTCAYYGFDGGTLDCTSNCHVIDTSGCFDSTVCGDGLCEEGENQNNCPSDCAPTYYCGDGYCTGGEDASNCPADCAGEDECFDTDGGFNTYVRGTTHGVFNNTDFSIADACVNTGQGVRLREYYCQPTQTSGYTGEYVDCSGNYTTCSQGACI